MSKNPLKDLTMKIEDGNRLCKGGHIKSKIIYIE